MRGEGGAPAIPQNELNGRVWQGRRTYWLQYKHAVSSATPDDDRTTLHAVIYIVSAVLTDPFEDSGRLVLERKSQVIVVRLTLSAVLRTW